jgi:hypothetical protein
MAIRSVVAGFAILCGVLEQPSTADAITSRNEVRVDSGFFGAGGFGGVSGARVFPSQGFMLEAGLGFGLSGVQASVMPRLMFGSEADRFMIGGGLSVGLPLYRSYVKGLPTWLDLELVGYQHRFRGGLTMFAAAGFMVGLGGGRYCSDCSAGDSETGSVFPDARLGLGYSF